LILFSLIRCQFICLLMCSGGNDVILDHLNIVMHPKVISS
jgi:hypothetical protein